MSRDVSPETKSPLRSAGHGSRKEATDHSFFLNEMSGRTPQKIFISIIFKKQFLDESIQKAFYSFLKTEALLRSAGHGSRKEATDHSWRLHEDRSAVLRPLCGQHPVQHLLASHIQAPESQALLQGSRHHVPARVCDAFGRESSNAALRKTFSQLAAAGSHFPPSQSRPEQLQVSKTALSMKPSGFATIVVGGRVFDIACGLPNMYIVVYIDRIYK